MKKIQFENPANGYVETIEGAVLGVLLLGPLYFAFKGVWGAAILWFIANILTFCIAWVVMPFFAEEAIRKHYLTKGWREIPQTGALPKVATKRHTKSREELEAMIGIKKH